MDQERIEEIVALGFALKIEGGPMGKISANIITELLEEIAFLQEEIDHLAGALEERRGRMAESLGD